MTPVNIRVIVARIEQTTESVKVFTLKRPDGRLLPAFAPGAHVTVKLQNRHQNYIRHYSICSDPGNLDAYRVAVQRANPSRGGSAIWHDEVQLGDTLAISTPKNHFTLSDHAHHHIFIAGGIGITPFLPMMRFLSMRGQTYELHYAARSQLTCAFYQMIKHDYPDTRFYFSTDPEASRLTPDILNSRRVGTHIYICGPRSMIDDFTEAAIRAGYSRLNLHFERFTANDTGHPHAPFDVWLRSSERYCHVPAGETLLTALNKLQLDIPYSCQIGGCGACEVPVAGGDIEHRDFYLSDMERAAGKTMLPCVSRAKPGTQLILDL